MAPWTRLNAVIRVICAEINYGGDAIIQWGQDKTKKIIRWMKLETGEISGGEGEILEDVIS